MRFAVKRYGVTLLSCMLSVLILSAQPAWAGSNRAEPEYPVAVRDYPAITEMLRQTDSIQKGYDGPTVTKLTMNSGPQQDNVSSGESSASSQAAGTTQNGTGSKNITNYSQAVFKWVWAPICGILISLFLLLYVNIKAVRNKKKQSLEIRPNTVRKLIVRKRNKNVLYD